MLAFSAFDMGTRFGTFILLSVGISLVVKGFRSWQAAKVPVAGPAMPIATSSPTGFGSSATPGSPPTGDDFFSGGNITPATAHGQQGGPNAAITDARWHPDYSTSGSRTSISKRGESTGLIFMLVGALAFCGGLYFGYERFLAPGRGLEFPDQLIGMERDTSNDEAIDAVEKQMATDTPGIDGDVELETALYTSGNRLLIVMGGEEGADNSSDYQEFEEGMQDGLQSSGVAAFKMTEVESGSMGGKMWCTEQPVQSVSMCAWMDDDTFALVVLSAQGMDLQESAQEIREAVER